MEVIFTPFTVFQACPMLAIVPAALIMAPLLLTKGDTEAKPTKMVLSCACLWIAYSLWEYRVHAWAENEVAPIRVDLLLIAPLLLITTVGACVALVRWRHKSN